MITDKLNLVVFHSMFRKLIQWVALFLFAAILTEVCRGVQLNAPALEKSPPEIGLDRLRNQRSFRFEWRFERPGVEGDFKGSYHYPDNIGMRGSWQFGKHEEKGEWIASGDEQFEWDQEMKEWKVLPRGEETDPLRQMFRILHFPKFEFLREDRYKGKRFLVYSFDPNAPFLDPSMEKELKGEIWTDPKTHLPYRVRISELGVRDSEIHWELLLSKFNKPVKIKTPAFQYRLNLKGPMKGVRKVLLKRMEGESFEDVAFRVERDRMRVGFRTSGNPERLLEHLIAPGNLRIYLAQFPSEPVSKLVEAGYKPAPTPLLPDYQEKYGEDALLVFEGEDVTKPLIIQKLLVTEGEVSEARVGFDAMSRPVLQLTLTKKGKKDLSAGTQGHMDRPLGVMLDGMCLSSPILRKLISGRSFEISGEFTLEEVEGMVLRLRAGPIPHPLEVLSLKKL